MEFIIIPIIIIVVVAAIILGAAASAKRRKLLAEWASANGLSYSRAKERGWDDRYSGFKHLQSGSNRYAHNIIRGTWKERSIAAFDYHYETHSRDSKGRRQTHNHHFSAVILSSDLPLKPLFIRPEGFFDKITEFFGYDDIDFESAEFSRKFYVKAQDRRWAYDVLHARAMQFLLDGPRFTMQFDRDCVIAYSSGCYDPKEYEAATGVIEGLLDQFPDYLVQQLREGH
jgi:hypothetical protein